MKQIYLSIIFLIITGCGFKVINQGKLINFQIDEIKSTGDKKINYKIKNKLLFISNDAGTELISIDIKTDKNKLIKEKNIKNDITKYNVTIKVLVKIKDQNLKKLSEFTFSEKGDYAVASQHSQTIYNEKKITELLTTRLIDSIVDELILRMNDF